MAQHDYVIANGTGAAVRSDLNNALAAIVSQNSGATEPSTTYAYQFWADTTTNLLKLRNSANSAWITLFQLDGEWSTLPVENGTAAAPSIYFKDSGTDTGFYSPGTDQVGIATGGTARMTIDSNGNLAVDTNSLYVDAANNRVGIGTSSPSSTAGGLDISSGGIGLVVGADGSTVTRTNSTDKISRIGSYHYTNAEEPVCIAFGQNLSSDNELNFGGGSAALNAATYIRFFTAANNTTTTGTERLRITSAGNVGIGNTAPDVNLVVEAATGDATLRVHAAENNSGSEPILILESSNDFAESIIEFKDSSGTGGAIRYNHGDNAIRFQTNGSSERARIDSSGRLLVGTSSATSAGELLRVEKASTGTEGTGIRFGGTYSLADGATQSFTIGNGALVFISENAEGDGALFFCSYRSATVTLLSDPNNRYANSDTATKICVFKSANSGTVSLKNRSGSTGSFTIGKVNNSD